MELNKNTFYICKVCGEINYTHENGYKKTENHCQRCNRTQAAVNIEDLSKKLLVRNTIRIISEKINNFSKFNLTFEKSNKTYDFTGAIEELKAKENENLSNSQICAVIEKHIKEVKKTAVVTYNFKFDYSIEDEMDKIQLFKNDEKMVNVHAKAKQFVRLYKMKDFVPEEIAEYVKYGSSWDKDYVYNSILSTFKNPYREILVKAGYGKMYLDDWKLNTSGRNPADILCVNKDKAKFLKELLNASREDPAYKYYDFANFDQYWNIFIDKKDIDLTELKKYLDMIVNNCSNDQYEDMSGENTMFGYKYNYQSNKVTLDSVLQTMELARSHNIKMDRLFEYLTIDLREKQGIVAIDLAFRAYREYIKCVDDLNIEYEKYPLSLIQMHDKLSWQRAMQSVEINKRKFAANVEQYKKYEYENDTYMMITPNNMDDMRQEGANLNNCVATYIEKFINGHSKVFFMRKKEEPDKSYIAVELNEKNGIVQRRGHSNRYPHDFELDFINEWHKHVKDVDAGKVSENHKQEEFNCAV